MGCSLSTEAVLDAAGQVTAYLWDRGVLRAFWDTNVSPKTQCGPSPSNDMQLEPYIKCTMDKGLAPMAAQTMMYASLFWFFAIINLVQVIFWFRDTPLGRSLRQQTRQETTNSQVQQNLNILNRRQEAIAGAKRMHRESQSMLDSGRYEQPASREVEFGRREQPASREDLGRREAIRNSSWSIEDGAFD